MRLTAFHRLRPAKFASVAFFKPSIFIAMLLLGACASNTGPDAAAKTSVQNDSIRWQQHLHGVQKIAGWYVTAKIIIKSADERFSGYLAWQQNQTDYEIDFIGPMGAGAMRITGNAVQSSLMIPDKPAYTGNSPEQLLRDNTGYRLPVSQFYYWARGVPNPELPYQPQLNHRGQLKQLRQLDWDLEYSDYQPYNGAVLPGKVVMNNGGIQIKLIRLNWQAIDSAAP